MDEKIPTFLVPVVFGDDGEVVPAGRDYTEDQESVLGEYADDPYGLYTRPIYSLIQDHRPHCRCCTPEDHKKWYDWETGGDAWCMENDGCRNVPPEVSGKPVAKRRWNYSLQYLDLLDEYGEGGNPLHCLMDELMNMQ
jgi:hypothetical protein